MIDLSTSPILLKCRFINWHSRKLAFTEILSPGLPWSRWGGWGSALSCRARATACGWTSRRGRRGSGSAGSTPTSASCAPRKCSGNALCFRSGSIKICVSKYRLGIDSLYSSGYGESTLFHDSMVQKCDPAILWIRTSLSLKGPERDGSDAECKDTKVLRWFWPGKVEQH